MPQLINPLSVIRSLISNYKRYLVFLIIFTFTTALSTCGGGGGETKIPKPVLTVTAENKAITHGDPTPTFTYKITGFVDGDDVLVVTGTPDISCGYVQSVSGSHSITAKNILAADIRNVSENQTITAENILAADNKASDIAMSSECDANCATCDSNNICTSCKTGYYLSGGSCLACGSGCTTCANVTGNCYTCASTSQYVVGNMCKTCSITASTSIPCWTCDGKYCQTCNDGFYKSGQDCEPCHTACATCNDGTPNNCFTCKAGFYLHQNHCGTCPDVIANCTSCTQNGAKTVCNSCASGYDLIGGACVQLVTKTYTIVISKGTLAADDYDFEFVDGTLTVERVPIVGVSGTSGASRVGGEVKVSTAQSEKEFYTLYTEKEQIPFDKLLTLEGEQYSGEELRGKYTLVTFWASWCPYCRSEMPSKQWLYSNFTNENFTVLIINAGEDAETIADFMSENFFDIPVVRDADNELKATYANGIPTSYILDPEGNIIARINGSNEWDSEQALRALSNLTGGAVNSENREQAALYR